MQKIGILDINEQAEKIPGCIRFDKGSAKFPFPEEFLPCISKLKNKIKGKYLHYPKTGGEDELKKEIVKEEGKSGRQVTPENIIITHGGMSGLFAFFYNLLRPGDEVITNSYCFEGFSLLIKHFGLIQKRVDFSDIEKVKRAVSPKVKAIILNSPENPTGKVYTKEEIERLVKIARQRNLWLLSDEVMNRITYDGIKWVGPTLENDNIVIVNSFSKNWFIPGIRVGWMVCRNKKAIENFSNFISLYSVGVNLFDQLLLTEILRGIDYKKFLKHYLAILARRKALTEKCLKKHNINWLHKVQGGMNFYVDLRQDSEKASCLLLKKGVAIIPGNLFEGEPSTYARLGFGAVTENEIEKGIQVISLCIH